MRLIIVDDSNIALDKIVDLVIGAKVLMPEDIVCIKCGDNQEGEVHNKKVRIESAGTCDEVMEALKKLDPGKGDAVLFDVGIFGEKEEQVRFTEFGSVKCAMYLKNEYPDVKCRFYTVIYGATRLDFARETNYCWGEPLLRPIFTDTAKESNKKRKLLEEIRNMLK